VFRTSWVPLQEDSCICSVVFYVHVSVHRESMSIIVQQNATIYSLLYFYKLLYIFGCLLHPSSGAHITVITAYGTGQTISAPFRYRGEVGNGSSATTLPIYPRRCILISYFNKSNFSKIDDGVYTETCWSCFNVNFKVNFNFLRQFNCASVGK